MGCEGYKTKLAYSTSVAVRISTLCYVLLESFIIEVLAILNRRIKFVCIPMCSLVMSLCSHDLHVMSLHTITIH